MVWPGSREGLERVPSKEEGEFHHLVTLGLAQEGLQVPWGGVKWPRDRCALTADHRGP